MIRFVAATLLAASFLCSGTAWGQEQYPGKVVRIITPATGGGADVVARMIAPGLTAALGSTPEELAAKMKAEITRVAKLVKEAGLREE